MLICLTNFYALKHLALAKYLIDFKLYVIRDYINIFSMFPILFYVILFEFTFMFQSTRKRNVIFIYVREIPTHTSFSKVIYQSILFRRKLYNVLSTKQKLRWDRVNTKTPNRWNTVFMAINYIVIDKKSWCLHRISQEINY